MQQPSETSFDVSLPNWSGPLDLLLDLIRASKLKIQEISIKKITRDYLDAIDKMTDLDMNLSSEFMAMASHLIYIKSKMLLPEQFNDDEKDIDDPKKDLIEKLLNYEKFKLAADKLNHLSREDLTFIETTKSRKERKKIANDQTWEEVSIIELIKAFSKIMESNSAPPILSDQEFKTEEKISYIKKELKTLQKIKFENLFKNTSPKQEIVVTLWAVLEMYKTAEIEIMQNKQFGEIFLFPSKAK